ncbi:P-loop containing nucleoside triphosphate hydrolase protein [Lyophyllum atratum]|nr:P-loop containing nucleoside triphosphate hydrolase protein [Lyophyllum atratum]
MERVLPLRHSRISRGGKYRVVTINPEVLMDNDEIAKLWHKPSVTKHILYITFDEGHCVSTWNTFRNQYKHVGDLRYLISEDIPFYVASATLPPAILLDVAEILRLRSGKTEHIIRSNDRPEISIMVRGLNFTVSSFKDLDFLVPKGFKEGDPPLPKFLIFFDNTKEAEAACHHLRMLLPPSLRKKIKWFHSTMTLTYRDEELMNVREGDTWGLCGTDSIGMGMDLPDIEIVIQWKATCDLCTLWQRFGQAGRGRDREGVGILLVEKKHLDEERVAKAGRAAKRTKKGAGTKHKAKDAGNNLAKRPALADRSINRVAAVDQGTDSDDGGDAEEPDDADGSTEAPDVGEEGWIAVMEERRIRYGQREPKSMLAAASKGKGKARADIEIGSPMDDFINASGLGCKCRRIVTEVYFANDRTLPSTAQNDHLLCDPTTELGCRRCAPRKPRVCCDLCASESFDKYRPTPLEKSARAPSKSTIKKIEMTTTHYAFKRAIFDWRKERAVAKFGELVVRRLGAKMLSADELVDRIVECAPAQKPLLHASGFFMAAY